jgi:hypothetical protein
LKDVK